jgi:uncharacterized protein (DUF1499 family)
MISAFARYALLLAVLCAITVAVSGSGYRIGWWPLPTAFGMLRWSTYAAMAAIGLGAVGAVLTRPGTTRRGFGYALAAMVIGMVTIAGPLTLMARARQVPPIHDISTDTDDPPQFVAVLPLRAGAANPAAYGGPEVAAQQKKAFPHIVPLALRLPPEQAFARALIVAQGMGWEIAGISPADGRIEATDTTPFFGFKDDVVIRVTAAPAGSRIDMRSLSRIGRSDLGTNARRIGNFLRELGGDS